MKQGIHLSIPSDIYHADCADGISLSSGIAKLLLDRPPLWAWTAHPKLNPDFKKSEPKAAFDIGHAAHAMLLENGKGIVVCEFDNWLTKDAKAKRDDARANGYTPVLSADYECTREMARIAADALMAIGINVNETDNECTMIAEVDGVLCRTRPDIYMEGLILDYKTSSRPVDQFDRQASKFGYSLQYALYVKVAKALGKNVDWLFAVQEVSEPFPIQLFRPTADFIAFGNRQLQEAMAIWKNCLVTGEWPGYDQEIQLLDAAPWECNELNEDAVDNLVGEW